ncbi:MAG TPA: TetR/AcrR family transcriptional regulator, partial [Burkholderiaceae bacterium]|nr:TetR/AcrR family transcriptional regulator [Burkholderiaceae bacterium]
MPTVRQPKATARRTAPPKSGKRHGNGAARTGGAQQGGRATYHHGNLRDALVAQGLQMLEGGGAASLSLRQVAERTGVSPAAPLHHFETKEALLAAIAAEGFRRLFEHRIRSLRDKADAVERLLAVMMASVDFALANPALFHLMFGPEI